MTKRSRKSALLLFALLITLSGCNSADNDSFTADNESSTNTPVAPTDPAPDTSVNSPDTTVVMGCDDCKVLPAYTPSQATGTAAVVHVSEYGAQGNNTGADHAAIQRAVNAAGDGGFVQFSGGRTYTLCQMVTAKENQTWQSDNGQPARLRRCDAIVSNLSADVPAGSSRLPLSTTEGFEVGMWVSPVISGSNDFHAGELAHHPITAITDNTLRITNGLDISYQAGDKVVTSFAMVQDNIGVTFEGLLFDGNASGNDHFVSWARHSSLWLKHEGSQVNYCRFIASQGDAITVQGLNNVIEFNDFSKLNGSAIHLSSARNTRIHNNHIQNSNLKAARVDHAEAAITWSLENRDIVVENNCIRDVPVAAFGDIAVHGGNRGATLRANQICNVASTLEVLAVETLPVDLQFSDNSISSGGRMQLRGRGNATLSAIQIRNNELEDVMIRATDVSALTITDNRMRFTDDNLSVIAPSATAHPRERHVNDPTAIAVRGGTQTTIANNTITGGQFGIHISNSNNVIETANINSNTLSEQVAGGILVGDIATIDALSVARADFRGVSVMNNTVRSSYLAENSAAVELGRGANFTDNCVESNYEGVRIHGYTDQALQPHARITGNHVLSAAISFTASSPYTGGIEFIDNSASNGVSTELLESNAQAQTPNADSSACR